jgi:copper ion binding protein
MKHLLIITVGAALWSAPGIAQACGCCNHDDHHAATHAPPSSTAKLGPGEARVEIPVTGMHCGHCVSRVEAALAKLDGVRATDVRMDDGKVIVVFEKAKLAPAKIVETIDALGFKAGPPVQG